MTCSYFISVCKEIF